MTEPDLLIKLGKKIKTIQAFKNMTQNQLANKCKFGKATMSRIGSDQCNPTVRTLYKISKSLDVPIVELLTDL